MSTKSVTFQRITRTVASRQAAPHWESMTTRGALAIADEFKRGMPGLIAEGDIHDARPGGPNRKSGCPPFSKEVQRLADMQLHGARGRHDDEGRIRQDDAGDGGCRNRALRERSESSVSAAVSGEVSAGSIRQ